MERFQVFCVSGEYGPCFTGVKKNGLYTWTDSDTFFKFPVVFCVKLYFRFSFSSLFVSVSWLCKCCVKYKLLKVIKYILSVILLRSTLGLTSSCWVCLDQSAGASPSLTVLHSRLKTEQFILTPSCSCCCCCCCCGCGCCCCCICCCCCCHSPAALLLSSVVQVEEVCDCNRVALTVEQMFYGVWCHSTLRTNI